MEIRGLIILILLSLLMCSNSTLAQTYDSFKNKQQEDFREFKEKRGRNFQEFIEERAAYIEKLDQQFTQFLHNYWEDYNAFKSQSTPQKPGPDQVPEYTEQSIDKLPSQPLQNVKAKTPDPEPVHLPVLQKKSVNQERDKPHSLTFFGATFNYQMPSGIKPDLPPNLSNEAIATQWKNLSKTNYYPLLNQSLEFKNEHNLNDWGYYLLLRKLSNQLCKAESNNATCLQWFLLTKAQYDSRLGYQGQSLHLLLPFQNSIYNARYFKVGNNRYYLLDANANNLTICKKNYKPATRVMDLNIDKSPHLPVKTGERTINYNEESMTFRFNKNLMTYYNQFPQADLQVYFNAATASITKESVRENLQPLIADKSEREAVATILDFVQQFKYKTDQEQFGKEKFFFPAEVFYYPYADCEDRSALFAYIVQELLGLKVLALEYPEHVATAVNFTKDQKNHSLKYKGEEYVVCDPTYKNAPMGLVIPQCKDQKAEILVLNDQDHQHKRAQNLWQVVNKAGGYQGTNTDNIAFDENGKAYLTGYFSGKLELGAKSMYSAKEGRDVFVACFDSKNNLKWVKVLKGPGQDMGYHLVKAKQKEGLYLAGMFNQKITNANHLLKTQKQADLFVAHISQSGKFRWLSKAGLNDLESKNNANFAACFDASGKHTWNRVYNQSDHFEDYGISTNDTGQIFIKGGLQKNTGFRTKQLYGPGDPQGGTEVLKPGQSGVKKNKVTYKGAGEFDAVTALKQKSDQLKKNQYDPTVAGLFAVIELIKNSGMEIEGAEVQKALDKYNPDFQTQNPTIYSNIGNIRFIKNANGIVKIETQNGSSVSFSNMEIADGSRIKITRHANGNAVIEVLSGIEVGKAIVWYNLNSIKLHRKKPELVFDYSDEHTKKTLSMNEILD